MPDELRQIPTSKLAKEQQVLKLEKDAEYKIASDNLAMAYYHKKHTEGATPVEDAAFKAAHDKSWQDYLDWAINQGLYREVTVEEQLREQVAVIEEVLPVVNELRKELGLAPIKLIV